MAIFLSGRTQLAYEVHGAGFPILLIAFGGSAQNGVCGEEVLLNPLVALRDHFQVIAMDQRNAGESTGPIESDHDWSTYTQDQLDLMTHLGHERFSVVGMYWRAVHSEFVEDCTRAHCCKRRHANDWP